MTLRFDRGRVLPAAVLALWLLTGWCTPLQASAGTDQQARWVAFDGFEIVVEPVPEESAYRLKVNRSGRTVLNLGPELCALAGTVGPLQNAPAKGCGMLAEYCYSGGAHCCTTLVVLTQCQGAAGLVTVQAEHSGPELDLRDVNGDGVVEMALADWSFAYYETGSLSLPFVSSPYFDRFGVWDGSSKSWRSDRPGEFERFYREQVEACQTEYQRIEEQAGRSGQAADPSDKQFLDLDRLAAAMRL